MTGDKQDKLEEIYSAALRLDAVQRPGFVRLACGEDEAMQAEIESLLAREEGLGSFLKEPAIEAVTTTTIDESLVGHRLGRYHLLQKIGEGGMGEVWLAEQKEPVRRRVALKLVKAGMNTREVLARFESERQALALMDHPTIAKVFDADSTPRGTPYFVMEYVAGVFITAYCDNHRLGTRERLELFMRVCEGVQHAHQKAIIHRDLKPSNILVTEVDGRAVPKIIDFGVAKALSQKLTADTLFTRVRALVGTPEYMSPEQALSSGEDIDTRTDVYSLGVIFYELLGVPPLELRKVTFEELLRRLREEEPSKPSTKIRTQAPATSKEVARNRQTEVLALARQFRGDLDSIALKALEKDRSRRYGSPSDFAAELLRYLRNEPVLAVPPSTLYRARKFARRYRGALVTACAFALVLMLAAGVSISQSVRANREAAVAQAVNDFLQNDLLAQASVINQLWPSTKPDPDLKVRSVLDRAAARITGKFDRQPEVQAAIRDTIGQTYMELGLYPEARTQLERAVDLYRRVLGAANPKTLKAVGRLGFLAYVEGKYAEAEALLSQTLETQSRVLGRGSPDTLASMSNLSNVYKEQGKYEQAEAFESQSLAIRRFLQGSEHPDTLYSMNNLANIYQWQGKYTQAEALASQTLEICRRTLGPEHPGTLMSMYDLAMAYQAQGKYAQAEPLFRQTLDIQRRVLGPEHPLTLLTLLSIASMYQRQGKYALAEKQAVRALAGQRHALGPEHLLTLDSEAILALSCLGQGKFVESERLAREVFEIDRKTRPDDWQRFGAQSLVGASLVGQKKYAEAEPLLLEGYQGMLARKDRMGVANSYYLDRARGLIVLLYQAWGKPEKAAAWKRNK